MANDYGTVGLGESVEGNVNFHFCYQATASFPIKVNAGEGASITLTYEDLSGSSVTLSTGTTFSLPASTFCYVKIEVTGGGGSTYLS